MKSLSLKQLFLGAFFFSIFIIGCKVDKIDDLEPVPQRAVEEEVCLLQISGKVLNTKDFEPLQNVQINSTFFTVETDGNGEFEIEVDRLAIEGVDQIQVSKEGYLLNEFFADYKAILNASSCSEVTSIDWELSLSPKQASRWVGVDGMTTFHIMDTIAFAQPTDNDEIEILQDTRDYTVEIKEGALEKWANLSISPNNGTAFGTGIVLSENSFSLARLVIVEEGGISPDGLVTTYPNELVNFKQAIEISFTSPTELFEQENQTLTSLDIINMTKNELGSTVVADNKVKIDLRATGNLYIGFNEETTDLVANALEAIKNGYETDETINALNNNSNSNARYYTIWVSSSVYCPGTIIKQRTFSNCNCAQPKWRRYTVSTRNYASANIQFPSNTPRYLRRYAYNAIYGAFGSGGGRLSASYWVYLPKCTRKQVTSETNIRKVSGTVYGFPFYHEGLDLSTTAQILDCPTTSACHQGCSN